MSGIPITFMRIGRPMFYGCRMGLFIGTKSTHVLGYRRELLSPVSSNQPHSPLGPSQLRRVHIITDRFSMANTYLIAEERLVVVDPGSELIIDQLHGYLQRVLRRAITDIDMIVLTHLQFGYTTGLKILHRHCNAPIAASSVVRQLAAFHLKQHAYPARGHTVQNVFPTTPHHFERLPPDYQRQVKLIDLWLDDGDALPYHPDWCVIGSPVPTPEALCLYNPSTWELLCGDTMVIQSGAPLLRSGTNRYQLEETWRIFHNLPVHYLYPTHGRCLLGLHPLKNISLE
jgi:hydroxyacylglutathione hydrolase